MIVSTLKMQSGGLWLVELQLGGRSHHQRVAYTEVTASERLVWLPHEASAAAIVGTDKGCGGA